MESDWVLWYDARCPTSRRALELLRERGVEPGLRRHLTEPPTAAELSALAARLGRPVHGLCRTDEDEYQALRLSARTPEPELLAALVRHPRILERPILVGARGAVVARPAERVLELVEPGPASQRDR
jgi:arsenate reductase